MLGERKHCASAAAGARRVLTVVARQIESHWDTASKDLDIGRELALREPSTTGKRGREIDDDLKNAVLQKVARGDSANVNQLIRTHLGAGHDPGGYGWIRQDLLRYQAAAWMSGPSVRCLSVASDGSKIGSPAEETVIYSAWFPRPKTSGFGVWMIPQAQHVGQ